MNQESSESIYGNHLPELQKHMEELVSHINDLRAELKESRGMDPVDHLMYRIKSEESMREKCRRKGLPENENSALHIIHDAIGIRIVTSFIDDVYRIRDHILSFPDYELIQEKDYIKNAKSNGYRSLHLILSIDQSCSAEIQLRTISMDNWAALEHQLKYKKHIQGNEELISSELKRIADEMASTDISMQTIRKLICEEESK